jgi:3-methyladenine DNA glycosylase AlkD
VLQKLVSPRMPAKSSPKKAPSSKKKPIPAARVSARAPKASPESGAAKSAASPRELSARVKEALAWLEREGSARVRADMAPRYGIHTEKAFGVAVGSLRKYAKGLGKSPDLAAGLWDTGWYEARMLATFVDDAELVTPAQMDRWCRDFDNWAICDTACFHLFDRSPHAFAKIDAWAKRREEFVKRAAFALLASMALHGRGGDDAGFARGLVLVEREAVDERNFVKKAVNWALRAVGRRSAALNAQAVAVARRLGSSSEPAARWVGKGALRELLSPATQRRFSSPKKA